MIRSTIAALGGYLVIAVIVMSLSMITFYGFGNSFVFEEGTVNVSMAFMVTQLIIGAIAALIGGWATALFAKHERPQATMILVGIIVMLGFVFAAGSTVFPRSKLPDGKSVEELSFSGVGQYAVQPKWYPFALPIVGAIAAFAGSKLFQSQMGTATKDGGTKKEAGKKKSTDDKSAGARSKATTAIRMTKDPVRTL